MVRELVPCPPRRILTGEDWNDAMHGAMVKEDCYLVQTDISVTLPGSDGTPQQVCETEVEAHAKGSRPALRNCLLSMVLLSMRLRLECLCAASVHCAGGGAAKLNSQKQHVVAAFVVQVDLKRGQYLDPVDDRALIDELPRDAWVSGAVVLQQQRVLGRPWSIYPVVWASHMKVALPQAAAPQAAEAYQTACPVGLSAAASLAAGASQTKCPVGPFADASQTAVVVGLGSRGCMLAQQKGDGTHALTLAQACVVLGFYGKLPRASLNLLEQLDSDIVCPPCLARLFAYLQKDECTINSMLAV
eukprot:scaffold221383_cov15-Tisochrysis_lutea.AAC.1